MSPNRAGGLTGPEHYRQAERLEDLACEHYNDATPGDPAPRWMLTIARAQIHADLAKAAAVATQNEPADGAIREGWLMVVGP